MLGRQVVRAVRRLTGPRMQHSASQVNIEKDPIEQPQKEDCPVCAYTEWDPLEEVIVGRPEGARVPQLRPEIKATIKPGNWDWIKRHAGKPQDPELVKQASKEVEEFCRVLEIEGVTVRRPELINWTETGTMRTPDFEEGGFPGCRAALLPFLADTLSCTCMTAVAAIATAMQHR